jgi:hypothetical protein
MRLSKEASWGRLLKVSGFGTDTSGTPPRALPFMIEPSGGLEWRVVYFDHMIIRVE